MTAYRNIRKGFTLVEILIVVIILGILAAIVIPQFTNASKDARNSALQSTVQSLRSQILLYKLQHGEQLPNLVANWNPLTQTSVYGTATFGPYMQSTPSNQLAEPGVQTTVIEGTEATAPDGAAFGFVYNSTTGKIWGVGKDANDAWVLVGD